MLKLLIVDDEPIIRSGIRTIIEWEKYGYAVCGEAEDGPSAVEAITQLRPDLVLLDLHLPGFSGIEIIKKVLKENIHTHFLILSGYAEFEYAQEAINLDADGYIVKPIDEEILVEKIISIARKIRREAPEEHLRIQFMQIMEDAYREETGGPLGFNGEYVQAVFVAVDASQPEEYARRLQSLDSFFQNNICHTFHYREFAVFLFLDTPESVVIHLLENLCVWLEKADSWSAVTLGSRCRKDEALPGAGIRASCREAETLMENIFFYRNKKYLSPADILPEQKDNPARDIEEDAKKVCSYIQVIDHHKIRGFFQDLEQYFFHSGKRPPEIRQECMELMIEVRGDILKKIPALKDLLGSGKETLNSIMKLRHLGSIIDTMTENCLRISGCLPLLSADASFQRIISYVKNNYNDGLKLETLGQLFNYNCAYLGKRFKEYTGKSFHTYLDMLRIEAAKDLLRNTSMKVYEISAAVGYANTDYFYSKFKKYDGESPLIFRKKDG